MCRKSPRRAEEYGGRSWRLQLCLPKLHAAVLRYNERAVVPANAPNTSVKNKSFPSHSHPTPPLALPHTIVPLSRRYFFFPLFARRSSEEIKRLGHMSSSELKILRTSRRGKLAIFDRQRHMAEKRWNGTLTKSEMGKSLSDLRHAGETTKTRGVTVKKTSRNVGNIFHIASRVDAGSPSQTNVFSSRLVRFDDMTSPGTSDAAAHMLLKQWKQQEAKIYLARGGTNTSAPSLPVVTLDNTSSARVSNGPTTQQPVLAKLSSSAFTNLRARISTSIPDDELTKALDMHASHGGKAFKFLEDEGRAPPPLHSETKEAQENKEDATVSAGGDLNQTKKAVKGPLKAVSLKDAAKQVKIKARAARALVKKPSIVIVPIFHGNALKEHPVTAATDDGKKKSGNGGTITGNTSSWQDSLHPCVSSDFWCSPTDLETRAGAGAVADGKYEKLETSDAAE